MFYASSNFDPELRKSSAVWQLVVKKLEKYYKRICRLQITNKSANILVTLNSTLQFTSTPASFIISQTYEAFAFLFPLLNAAQVETKTHRVAAQRYTSLHQNLQETMKNNCYFVLSYEKNAHASCNPKHDNTKERGSRMFPILMVSGQSQLPATALKDTEIK